MTEGGSVAVPASTANLGGGFDTLGLALQLYLRVRIVDVVNDGLGRVTVVRSSPAVDGRNAVEQGYLALAARVARKAPSVAVEVESEIPLAAGLGSSAAASVAGCRVYEHVTGPVPSDVLLGVVTSLEGHADNAAAAIYGGLVSVVQVEDRDPVALGWRWPDALRVVVATPATELPTSHARAVLAPTVARADAVFNLQRALALVHALQTDDFGWLREATRDRWHQSSRAALVPHLDAVLALQDPDVLGAFLSGAGPSVAVLACRDFARVERLLVRACEGAGVSVGVRTLAVHQSSDVVRDAVASAPGRAV